MLMRKVTRSRCQGRQCFPQVVFRVNSLAHGNAEIEHQQCHGHGKNTVAEGGQPFDTLSGNTVVQRRHRTEFSGLPKHGQNEEVNARMVKVLGARWTKYAICRIVPLLSLLIASHVLLLAQDKPEPPDAPQPSNPQPSQVPDDKKDESPNPAVAAAAKTKDLTAQALDKARAWEGGWLTGIYVGKDQQRVPLTGDQRLDYYLKQTLTTPGAYMKRMFTAGFDQVRGVPYQWDDGWTGYAERFASREGQFISANSLAALGNAALKYEPRYDRCRCTGFWPRTKHAIIRNFLTYNESEVELRPQWALYAGAFGGGLISTSWKPKPRNPFEEGGRAAAEQGGYGAALNIFIEFADEINSKIGMKKKPQKF